MRVSSKRLGLVLPGGGARAAYQAGVLSRLAELFPELEFPVIAGVSAGAINASFLANHQSTFPVAARELAELWANLSTEDVLRVTSGAVFGRVLSWGAQLLSGGHSMLKGPRSLVDTAPLRGLLERTLTKGGGPLPGVVENINSGRLEALAISTTNYTTGKSVTFVQRATTQASTDWSRSYRRMQSAAIGVEHVMASAAIPVLFPAIPLQGCWHGDGGVRQTAPLSPAIELGAERILTISTLRTPPDYIPEPPTPDPYPPPAQIMGVLVNSIFLDNVDYDAAHLERVNQLLRDCPSSGPKLGLKQVDLMVLRPSADLGKLVGEYEGTLPASVRYLSRGWGTRESRSSDVLATLLFEGAFNRRVIALGRADVDDRRDELERFFA